MTNNLGLDETFAAAAAQRHSYFVGPRPPSLIAAAEQAVGFEFPPTYKSFVAKLGAGNVFGREFYGVINSDFTNSGVPDAIWITLMSRRDEGLPTHLLVVGDTGLGEYYVLDSSRSDADGEYPVAVWSPGDTRADGLQIAANNFGTHFREMFRESTADLAQSDALD